MGRKKKQKTRQTVAESHKTHSLTPSAKEQPQIFKGTKQAMLLALRESFGVVTAACNAAGIARRTHYDWLDSDPDYSAAVKEINEFTLDACERTVYGLMVECDHPATRLNAAKLILTAKGKERGYGTESRKVEHSGKIENDTKVEVVRVVHFPSNNTDQTAIPLPASWEANTSLHQPS